MEFISLGFRKVSGILARHYGICLVFTVWRSLSITK